MIYGEECADDGFKIAFDNGHSFKSFDILKAVALLLQS